MSRSNMGNARMDLSIQVCHQVGYGCVTLALTGFSLAASLYAVGVLD